MKIMVDLDGVLCDFNFAFAHLMNGVEYKDVDLYSENFPAVWNWFPHYGWHPETTARAWAEVRECGFFWKLLQPYPNAYEDLKHLSNLSKTNDIYFITNRPGKTAKAESEEWLASRGIVNPTVIVSDKKGLVCKGIGIDIAIDDSPDNLLDIFASSHATKCILFKRPYNVGYWSYFWGTVTNVREALNGI